jgi:hypothetical protein
VQIARKKIKWGAKSRSGPEGPVRVQSKNKKKKKNTYSDGKNELATTFILLPTVFKPLATKFIASYKLATGFSYEKASRSYFIFSKFEFFRISQIKLKLNETKFKPTCFCLLITNPSSDFTFEDLFLRFERIK